MDPMYLFKHHNTVECVILGVGLSSKCYRSVLLLYLYGYCIGMMDTMMSYIKHLAGKHEKIIVTLFSG